MRKKFASCFLRTGIALKQLVEIRKAINDTNAGFPGITDDRETTRGDAYATADRTKCGKETIAYGIISCNDLFQIGQDEQKFTGCFGNALQKQRHWLAVVGNENGNGVSCTHGFTRTSRAGMGTPEMKSSMAPPAVLTNV